MPAKFNNCVDGGGRVRTMPVKGDRYMHVCFKDGQSHTGEVKMKKKKKKGY